MTADHSSTAWRARAEASLRALQARAGRRASAAASAVGLCAALLTVGVSSDASADGPARVEAPPVGAENVGVTEHLGERIPLDGWFRDHTGARVQLRGLLRDRPAVLNFVYHSCPSFCSLVLDGTVQALKQQPWTVGEDYDVVTISIDPRDTPEIAAQRRRRTLYQYGRDSAERGWHFLVAERSLSEREATGAFGVYPAVERLTAATGFRYQWMPRQRQYGHPGVIMVLTADGRIARYLYGLEYAPQDVRLSLLEASEGRSVTSLEHALLYCYQYDASAQGYTLVATRMMQIGGGIVTLLVFGMLAYFWRRELSKKRANHATSRPATTPLSPGRPFGAQR